MKLGLVVPANLKYSPYVKYYTDILNKLNVEFLIMSWDKVDIEEPVDMVFPYHTSDFNRKKILAGHIQFAFKCRRYIKREKIDHLIIFTLAPLFFIGYGFLKRFKDKLFIDIRDDSPFRIHFQGKFDKIIELAHSVAISSPYYADWFKRECIQCHNVDKEMVVKYSSEYGKEKIKIPVTIVFAGYMIEQTTNIQVIGELAKSNEFHLLYIGNECDGKTLIREYVKSNQIRNVSYEGEYRKEDIVDIYRSKADLVNILRAKTIINRNALPNKLYDAILSGIPVVVFDHNEAIARYVKMYNLGVVITEQDVLSEKLKDYIKNYNPFVYKAGRTQFIELLQTDIKQFENKLSIFCRE